MNGHVIVLKKDTSSTITQGKGGNVATDTGNLLELGVRQGKTYNDVYFLHKE